MCALKDKQASASRRPGTFRTIWKSKRHELGQWAFYNVVISLMPVLLLWLVLAAAGKTNFTGPFIDGTILIFAATLSGASMSFFANETKRSLRKKEALLFNGLLVTLIIGSAGYAICVELRTMSPTQMNVKFAFLLSVLCFISALYFNYNIAAIQLAYTDSELMAQLIAVEAVTGGSERRELVEKAAAENEIDGTLL